MRTWYSFAVLFIYFFLKEQEQQMFSSSGYCYIIVAGIYCAGKGGIFRQRVKIKCKTRLKSSRKHKVFPSYSVSTNFLKARSSNEVTRFPCTCNVSVLVSSFHIFLSNTLLKKNDFVVNNTCTLSWISDYPFRLQLPNYTLG